MSQWTRQAIYESFGRFLEEKPLDRITVKDIAADCGITRNTFYYHFSDVFDLCVKFLEDRMNRLHLDIDLQEDAWESLLLIVARQATQNSRTVIHLFRSSKSQEIPRFIRRVTNMLLEKLFDAMPASEKVSSHSRMLIIDFYRCALEGVVAGWISEDAQEEPEILVHRISVLLKNGMRHAIEDASLLNS